MLSRVLSLVALAACLLVVLPAAALAQPSPAAIIAGTVLDPDGAAVTHARLTAAGQTLIGGARATETDGEGRYRFADLPPGDYQISASAPGFSPLTKSGLHVAIGQAATVDFVLAVGTVSQEVKVEARAPLIDVRSSAAPASLDRDLLLNLPTGRTLSSVLNLAPGVAGGVAFGGTQGGNGFYVDGEDTTDPTVGGSWTRFNTSWLQEVQVVGLGAGPEFGGFTGVAANAILRSGSNRFSGLGEYWTTPQAWVATNTGRAKGPAVPEFAGPPILESRNGNAQLGGPIARDRVWFFAALEQTVLETRPVNYHGPGTVQTTSPGGIVKISAALSPTLRLEGFYRHGHDRVDGAGLGVGTALEATSRITQSNDDWSGRLTWTIGARTLLEAKGTGFVSPYERDPRPPATKSGPAPHVDATTGAWSVNTPWYFDGERKRASGSIALSHYADRFAGTHDLKFGAEFERIETADHYGYPAGRIYFDMGAQPYQVWLWDGATARASATRVTAYGGDRWSPGAGLTLDAGLRVDINRARVPVRGQVFATSPFAPRVGLAWDATKDHRTVVRAHWGRYADPMFTWRISEMDTSESSPFITASVVGPGQFVEQDRTDPKDNMTIDPHMRHSHVDQALVGVEREVFWRMAVTAQYIHRRYADFMGLIDTGSTWAPLAWQDPGRDGKLGTPDDGSMMTIYNKLNPGHEALVYTNPAGAWRRYDGFQLIATRRQSGNWQAQASWTWTSAAGNVGNMQGVNASMYTLGNPGMFVNPNRLINMDGGIPFDFSEAKVLGTYRVPVWGGINVGGVYRYHTGQAYGRIVWATGLNQGSNQIRTERIGTYHSPAINQVDVRIEKTFPVSRTARVGLFFDVFNAANQGVPNAEDYQSVNQFSGEYFGVPVSWVDPRRVQVGMRVTF